MLVKEALAIAASMLKFNGVNNLMEARILLGFALKLNLESLILKQDSLLEPAQYEDFNNLLNRRIQHEPIAYILGVKEFYGRDFKVTNQVLIPRPDTEILIDAVLKQYHRDDHLLILEMAIGSGCIGLTLLLEFAKSSLEAVDISNEALKIAEFNAAFQQIDSKRFMFHQSDWFKNVKAQKFDIIISNPPYISQNEQVLMSIESKIHEPKIALYSESDDGLSSYSEIAKSAKNYLNVNGKIFLEIGYSQFEPVKKIFAAQGYNFHAAYKDLQGLTRAVVFRI